MEAADSRRRSVILFCLRFLLLVVVLVTLWWTLLPIYGMFLVQTAGGLLKQLFQVPIEYGEIRAAGILNTKSVLVFGLASGENILPIALLVTNVPPYLALVFATLGLGWRRRLAITGYGLAILVLGHIAFLVYALEYKLSAQASGAAVRHLSELPMAIAQFFLTLPFLLWIVFAYWERLADYFEAESSDPPDQSHQDP